ncbi:MULTISPECIES: hypothetical protein [unclassified Lacrimispora]|uniref:hypothetical protein n=1 Tax=unclassified Lacrimispora TaxID=2719232 RepID=UPI003770217E
MKKVKIIIMSIMLSTAFCINAIAGEWKFNDLGWKYQNEDGSYMTNTWGEINGKWYYFNRDGYMLSDTITPDGYQVNKNGEWTQSNTITNGTKNTETKYTFETSSNWVKKGNIPEGEYIYYPSSISENVIVKGSYSPMSNFNYIKLYEDDVINSGTYIPVGESGELDITKEGVFWVGKDIKAGTYSLTRLNPNDNRATCTVFASIPSSKDEFAPQHNIEQDLFVSRIANKTVTVKDGQYIQLIDCSADFVRP